MTWRTPFALPGRLLSGIIRPVRGLCLRSKITERHPGARIVVSDPLLPVTIKVAPGGQFILKGRLQFDAWHGLRERIFIDVGAGSVLSINGDFGMGPGCRLIVAPGAQLHIGGCQRESGAGMTERTMIMVRKKVTIGTDLLCAWGVFITDCDWHEIKGSSSTEETVVGDHVWIAPRCSVLKGSRIGDGSILATGTVTHKASYPAKSLVGGVPAKVLAQGREWSRDLKPLPANDPAFSALRGGSLEIAAPQ